MKAIILERRGEYAAVLCEDGTFANRRVSGEVGETVELGAEVAAFPARKNRWAKSAVAAALALAVTGSTLGYMGGTASAYVSLEVENSAIELTVNHFGRVIEVNAVSEDAEELADSLSAEVRHRTVEAALAHTMGRLREAGYVTDEDASVIAGVASDNTRRKEALARTVSDTVNGQLLVMTEASRAEREQAKEQRVSVGRYGMERDRLSGKDTEKETEEAAVPASDQTVVEQPEPEQTKPASNEAAQEGALQENPETPAREDARQERREPRASRNEEQPLQEQDAQGNHQEEPRGEPSAPSEQPPQGEAPVSVPENMGERQEPQQERRAQEQPPVQEQPTEEQPVQEPPVQEPPAEEPPIQERQETERTGEQEPRPQESERTRQPEDGQTPEQERRSPDVPKNDARDSFARSEPPRFAAD